MLSKAICVLAAVAVVAMGQPSSAGAGTEMPAPTAVGAPPPPPQIQAALAQSSSMGQGPPKSSNQYCAVQGFAPNTIKVQCLHCTITVPIYFLASLHVVVIV